MNETLDDLLNRQALLIKARDNVDTNHFLSDISINAIDKEIAKVRQKIADIKDDLKAFWDY